MGHIKCNTVLSRNNNAVGFTHGTKITPNRTVAINVGITAQMLQIKNAPLLNLNISGINESQFSKYTKKLTSNFRYC